MNLSDEVSIYILELADGKYYIGESFNPQKRISGHFNGTGSAWTKKYKPKSIVDVISNCDRFDEDKYTKIYMARYGIKNVRGGSYCQIKLSDETKKLLRKEIRASDNKCYYCGQGGHFIINCPLKKKCSRCQRTSHTKSECFAKTTLSGKFIGETKMCFKCKRKGHSLPECYAKKDVRGNPITWNGCGRCGRKSHWAFRCSKKKDVFNRPVDSTLWSKIVSSVNN